MRIARPFSIELEYVQRMMAWLLFVPAPLSVHSLAGWHAMQLGLGAGAITKFCHNALRMRCTAIELNPQVLAVCRNWFKLPPDGAALRVVLADADLDYAVRSAAFGIYFNQGQVCMANSRIIVEAPIYEAFCKAFVEKVRQIPVGDPAQPQTAVGPLIHPRQVEVIRAHIADAVSKGATLLAGGDVQAGSQCVFEPSVLTGVKPGMVVYNEESFGPLAAIYEARDYEHAVELANDTSYGLSSGIVTKDLQKAFDFALRVEAGSVHINDNAFDDDPNAPFGGFKGSGYGKENGRWSVADMTELKWVTVQLGERPLPF